MEKFSDYLINNTTYVFCKLHSGSNGEIQLGIDLNSSKLVTIKKITEFRHNDKYNKLKKQGIFLKSLIQSNILTVYEFHEYLTYKNMKITQEYCNSYNLQEFLTLSKSFSNYQFLDQRIIQFIVKNLCFGLKVLHNQAKVLHGDLQLKHIMITFPQYNDIKSDMINLNRENMNELKNFVQGMKCEWKSIKEAKNMESLLKGKIYEAKIKLIDFSCSRELTNNELDQISNLNFSKISDYISEIKNIGHITRQLLTGNQLNKEIKVFDCKINASIEILDFIEMILQDDPKKIPCLNEILNHDFIIKDPYEFDFVEVDNEFPFNSKVDKKKKISSKKSKITDHGIFKQFLMNSSEINEYRILKFYSIDLIDNYIFTKIESI